MRIVSRPHALPLDESLPDALFIACNSFERRCLAIATDLARSGRPYRARDVVIIVYGDRGDSKLRQKADAHLGELLQFTRGLAEGHAPERVDLEPYDLIGARTAFDSMFRSLGPNAHVLCDISTFTKPHLLFLLESAERSGRVASLRLAYTRARYGRYDALSWGAEEPTVLPVFGNPRSLDDAGSRLILFCGLEPERCYSVWRRFGQESMTQWFIDSGAEDLDRCAERAIRYNASYAKDAHPRVLNAFDIDAVVQALEDEYAACRVSRRHLFIAPMTTKWEAIATWEFFRRKGMDADSSIVYASPGRFNVSGRTRETWGDILVADVVFRGPDNKPLHPSAGSAGRR